MPVDDSGRILLDDRTHEYNGAVELAVLLANSREVEACAVRWWSSYALGRRMTPSDACTLARLTQSFHASGGHLRELMLDIVTSDPFVLRRRGGQR